MPVYVDVGASKVIIQPPSGRSAPVHWAEIVESEAGGGVETITGADGTKIVHARQLPDRPRLLMEIKRHCGDNLPAGLPDEAAGKP